MQERNKISTMDISVYIKNLRSNPRFSEDMLVLIEEDLRFGLSKKVVEIYSERKLDYAQMKVYSRCFRGDYEQEVIDVITREGLSGEQMAVALEFYEKNVPIGAIKEITENAQQSAFTMKKLFRGIMEKANAVEKVPDTGEAYAKELVRQVKAAVEKIEFQQKLYDAMNEKLKEIQTEKADAEIQNNLLKRLEEKEKLLLEKDTLLNTQQDQINEAKAENRKIKKEIEDAGREKRDLERMIEDMERGRADDPETKAHGANENVEHTVRKEVSSLPGMSQVQLQSKPNTTGQLWTGYQAAVLDANGNVMQMVPVNYEEKKREHGILTAFFSRHIFKKRIDIVKLVAEGNLSPGQLVQIRSAIEKGLSEKQLMVLIENDLPPEQMAGIIQIAEYENRQRG